MKQLCSFIEVAILDPRIFLKAQVYDLASDELPSEDKQNITNSKLNILVIYLCHLIRRVRLFSKYINYTAENWQLLTKISNFSELK